MCKAASRRSPGWRRRRLASDQGSAARLQSCQSLEEGVKGGVKEIIVFPKAVRSTTGVKDFITSTWFSRFGVNKKGTILCFIR